MRAVRTSLKSIASLLKSRILYHLRWLKNRGSGVMDVARLLGFQTESAKGPAPTQQLSLSEMLSESVLVHQIATGPGSVSEDGVFEVPYYDEKSERANTQPITKISGTIFIPSSNNAGTADLFALISPDPKIRKSHPTYMGTFKIDSDHIDRTEKTLRNFGIGVSRIKIPQPV